MMRKGRILSVSGFPETPKQAEDGFGVLRIRDSDTLLEQEVHCRRKQTTLILIKAFGSVNMSVGKEIYWDSDGGVFSGFCPVDRAGEQIKAAYLRARSSAADGSTPNTETEGDPDE